MKINIPQILVIVHVGLLAILMPQFNWWSIAILIAALGIDYGTKLPKNYTNMVYLLTALSVYWPLFLIFLVYLPFAVMGRLLKKPGFVKSYVLGVAVSFIPATIIYLISTYIQIPLSFPVIVCIFYLPVIIALIKLRQRSISVFEINDKEFMYTVIILFFSLLIGIQIADDNSLFAANYSREFYRIEAAYDGLAENGIIPLYDPKIGIGEPTYLWVPPITIMHIAVTQMFFQGMNPFYFINNHAVFMLFFTTLALGLLLFSIARDKKTTLNYLAVTAITLITGLNFYFLQLMESLRAFNTYAMAYLYLSIILDDPDTFNEYLILMFITAIIVVLHPAYGIGVVILAAVLFCIKKWKYIKDRSELTQFFSWLKKNIPLVAVTLIIIASLPIFYISTGFVYGDFIADPPTTAITIPNVGADVVKFFKDSYYTEVNFLSFGYPDTRRIDDHQYGFFLSVVGVLSLVALLLLWRFTNIKNYKVYVIGYIINLFILALITQRISSKVGGFYRTVAPYMLILLAVSILVLILVLKDTRFKIAGIAIIFAFFLHAVPVSQELINNIHQDSFFAQNQFGPVFDFMQQLPTDGRIMTYGMYSNVFDYGIGYFSGKYGARAERIELAINRSIYDRIHGQHSFGDPNKISKITTREMANYLSQGGYKYLFTNLAHPTGQQIAQSLFLNYSYGVYQNQNLIMLGINNTNYVEKVELVENLDRSIFAEEGGYKYHTIGRFYNYDIPEDIEFVEVPAEPEGLSFVRPTPDVVSIRGDFEEGDWVVFKENYFPRWTASMGGEQIPVYSNHHDFILLRANQGKQILLNYGLTSAERVVGMISLVGMLLFCVLVALRLRKEH